MTGRYRDLEASMNRDDFEAELSADGYQEIEFQELVPRPGKGRHRHHFAIRGLVISGTFCVTQADGPVVYGPGEIFSVADGELHDESVGSDGAHVVVGRKFSDRVRERASSRSG
jgi:hypothetical protein